MFEEDEASGAISTATIALTSFVNNRAKNYGAALCEWHDTPADAFCCQFYVRDDQQRTPLTLW
jgi:hypothetical protein